MVPTQDGSPTNFPPASGTLARWACRVVCLPIIALLAFGFGYGWYDYSVYAERRHPDLDSIAFADEIERRRFETTLQYGSFAGPQQQWEFMAAAAAAVLYGAIGWRWLGGPLALVQVVGLLTLTGAELGAAKDALNRFPDSPGQHWVHAAQGGLVAGLVAALGLHLLYRSAPSQPLTLRRVFLIVVLAAVFLAVVKACVHACYDARIAECRAYLRLMQEPGDSAHPLR